MNEEFRFSGCSDRTSGRTQILCFISNSNVLLCLVTSSKATSPDRSVLATFPLFEALPPVGFWTPGQLRPRPRPPSPSLASWDASGDADAVWTGGRDIYIYIYEGRPLLPVKEFRSNVKTHMSRKGNCSPRKAGDRTAKDMCQPRLTYNVHNT